MARETTTVLREIIQEKESIILKLREQNDKLTDSVTLFQATLKTHTSVDNYRLQELYRTESESFDLKKQGY